MFLLGVILYFAIIMITTLFVGKLNIYIESTSFIYVVGAYIAILISTKSMKDFWYGIKILCIKNVKIDNSKLTESIRVFDLLYKATLGICLIGFFIGIINMLHNVSDPLYIGPSIAISLLTVFYSTVFALVIITPAKFMLDKTKRNEE